MDPKLVCLFLIVLITLQCVEADFWYNHVLPQKEELEELNLQCIPGKTLIKVEEPPAILNEKESSSSEYEYDRRALRSHMNFQTEDKSCQICVCSAEGKDEKCSKRPAMNVNECIRMATLMEEFQSNNPFQHEKALSGRIRRDYLWHNDEIPYRSNAKCRRGHSYYSNSPTANDTDIDVGSEVDSLLDYNNNAICYYCVCSMGGDSVGCMSRNIWFCQHYRFLRKPNAMRDMYHYLFKQDRPVYFRSLSWRLRRTMDTGMFDLVDSVGAGSQSCVPFVSQYTDCNEENLCSGCSKCMCTGEGKWNCEEVQECAEQSEAQNDGTTIVTENELEAAFKELEKELLTQKRDEKMEFKGPMVPATPDSSEVKEKRANEYVVEEPVLNFSDEIISLINDDNAKYRKSYPRFKYTPDGGYRFKRAASDEIRANEKKTLKNNGTVIFHHVVDEINEDTLKNKNISGTITAQKVASLPQISRRTGLLANATGAVRIGSTHDDVHRDDNTVDTVAIHDDKVDLLVHTKIPNVVGNYTQETKDKELSKILVNELKGGTSELIGEKGTPVISNITFHPENDTLTAMAFIAGNLLNKLWNMEKEASHDQIDTEILKHEKISDLVELFKEPLNKRQEYFLKSALDKLSTAINHHDNVEDISLCKSIEEIKKQMQENNNPSSDKDKELTTKSPFPETSEALNKITGVLELLNKYEKVQSILRTSNAEEISENTNLDSALTKDEKTSIGLYGKTLQTITNLLVPKSKSKKLLNSLRTGNAFAAGNTLTRTLPNIKIDNLNMTTKDKIVMDYLDHIQTNPDCLLKKRNHFTPPSIEGDILLNLSEFFKIKSLSDLVKLVETEKPPTMPSSETDRRTYDDEFVNKVDESPKSQSLSQITNNPRKYNETKENLKKHLKIILNDIMELKNKDGKTQLKDVKITDALPCLSKLFNDDQDIWKYNNEEIRSQDKKAKMFIENKTESDGKIKELLKKLKNELKVIQSRRTNTQLLQGQRPKSAVVWERIVNNAAVKKTYKTRRNMDTKAQNINDLKAFLDKFDSWGSNTYKNYAFLHEVPPSEKLLLLRTFFADTIRYMKALEMIHKSLQENSVSPDDNLIDISEFVQNAESSLKLNDRVVKNIERNKVINKNNYNILPKKSTQYKQIREFVASNKQKSVGNVPNRYRVVNNEKKTYNRIQDANRNRLVTHDDEGNTKLTRDQIINQLIKNRMKVYLKTKEATGEVKNNMNYDIAQKILTHLQIGNIQLARELYKIFASQTQNSSINITDLTRTSDVKISDIARGINIDNQKPKTSPQRKAFQIEPLIEFEEPKQFQSYQDQFMKQLLNLKNMS